ncbi:heavy metal sensor histidine kinase [Pantoea sp. SM3]|uniref:heavy metal sensor histidine kinase n=1 Tax=Pantoea sp. SM3 TaxID=1628192 RepID=UPI0005F8891D|nr:heavy metal sensor histidine kinase [Pantoea sp. SM3]KJV30550.1 histidine kinase [Pantoea sp. SM3]
MLIPRNVPITVRLTLFFSLAMAIVLYSVSGLLYQTLRDQLNSKDVNELRSTLQFQKEIASTISERQGPQEQWQKELFEFIAEQDRLSLRIISPDGKVWSQSKNMRVPQSAYPAPTKDFNYQSWKHHDGELHEKYLITATTFPLKDKELWLVQAALNVSRNNEIIENYWARMQIAAALAILLFAACGYGLARRGLRPLRVISRQIETINVEELHTRLATERWPSELVVLASSFDSMLTRLEASFAQLTRFSSDLAHELRAPINNLISAASVTLNQPRSTAEYQDTLEAIVEEGERLSRTVSSMLFLARADNSREPLKKEQLNSANEFRRLIGFYDILAEEKNITLIQAGDESFSADPLHFQRAISNLLSNALHYTPAGGEIILRAVREPHWLHFSVQDSGEGIEPEHLPHLFERFYRADPSRTSAENTGLGLAIVKTIAELHGGKVAVISTPGQGSTFTFSIPQ